MNSGLLAGQRRNTWQNFEPFIVVAANGTPTQPTFGAGVANRCRYLRLSSGLVIAQYQVGLGVTGSPGVGDAYVLELPYAARRMQAPGVPQIIGQCMPYKTVTATPWETFAVVGLSDAWTSLGGAEDRYCQFYIPSIVGAGTGTWTAGSASTVVTHSLGYTPLASDIEFCLTSAPTVGAGNYVGPIIDTITSTQFTATMLVGASIGAASPTYAWKIRSEPKSGTVGSWLAGPNRPWISSFDSFFFEVMYEPNGA